MYFFYNDLRFFVYVYTKKEVGIQKNALNLNFDGDF